MMELEKRFSVIIWLAVSYLDSFSIQQLLSYRLIHISVTFLLCYCKCSYLSDCFFSPLCLNYSFYETGISYSETAKFCLFVWPYVDMSENVFQS